MNLKDLTFILPVHEFNEELVKRALDSVSIAKECKVIVVGPAEVLEQYDDIFKKAKNKISKLVNDGETDFCSQVNKAVMSCLTPYFSILESDDVYTNIWFKHVAEHIDNFNDVSIFLPIVEMVDTSDKTIMLSNEIAWSSGFADELGYIDNEGLKSYFDFQVSGGIIKTEDFISLGGLKPSLIIASIYEMLLRFTYNGKKVYVIPRIGYKHTCGRDGSCMVKWKNDITQEHGEWLIKTAQNEMFFKEDRKKVFEK